LGILGGVTIWLAGLGWFAAGRHDIGGPLLGTRALLIVGIAAVALVIWPAFEGVPLAQRAITGLMIVLMAAHVLVLPPISAWFLARAITTRGEAPIART
jgi:hypothetical protein